MKHPARDCNFLKADSDGVPATIGAVRKVNSRKDTHTGTNLR